MHSQGDVRIILFRPGIVPVSLCVIRRKLLNNTINRPTRSRLAMNNVLHLSLTRHVYTMPMFLLCMCALCWCSYCLAITDILSQCTLCWCFYCACMRCVYCLAIVHTDLYTYYQCIIGWCFYYASFILILYYLVECSNIELATMHFPVIVNILHLE